MAYLDTASGDLNYDYPSFKAPKRQPGQMTDYYPDGYPTSTTEPVGGKVQLPSPTPDTVGDQQAPKTAAGPTRPTGGSINDPAYLDQLLAYYGQQPGVNPSVTNDPGYWRGAVGSGRFKGDENYLIQRFFQPEGAPEGGGQQGGGALDAFLSALASQKSDVAKQRQGILDRLMGLADQYSKPVTAQDPSIAAASDAYGAQTDRALQQYREQAAERAHAEGVPTGAFDAQIGGAVTSAGMAKASNVSSMVIDQLNKQRAQLSDVLSQGAGILSAQDQADIQNKVANIDAALKKEGLNLQGRSLDIQQQLGQGGLDLQRLGLTNQNNQFYDQFASNNAKDLNQNDIVELLRSLGII